MLILTIVTLFIVDFSEIIFQGGQSTVFRLLVMLAGSLVMRGRELIFFLSYCLFSIVSMATIQLESDEFAVEMIGRSRFLLLPLAVAVGRKIGTREQLSLPYVGAVIMGALAINVAASLFGLGMTQYGLTADGAPVAVKGAYAGGNEVSILYALAVIFLLHRSGFRILKYGAVVVLMSIGVGMWLGTKTAVLFSALCAIVLTKNIFVKLPVAMATGRVKLGAAFVSIIVIPAVLSVMLSSSNLGIANRFDVLLTKLNYDYAKVEDVASVATSGRLVTAAEIRQGYLENVTPVTLALGFGWIGSQKLHPGLQAKQAESDPLDLFIAFGLVGVATIYLYWLMLLRSARKRGERTLVVAVMVLLLLSVVPGHVMYSSLAPVILGLVLGQRLRQHKLVPQNQHPFLK